MTDYEDCSSRDACDSKYEECERLEKRLAEAERLLYGCLVAFSNDDEEGTAQSFYEETWKFLNLAERMDELKHRAFPRLADSAPVTPCPRCSGDESQPHKHCILR
jgi:hypothetical protein